MVVEGVRVGVGFGGDTTHSVKKKRLKRRVSILLFDSVMPIFGIASHYEISHLDVKSVVFFFLKKRKSTYTFAFLIKMATKDDAFIFHFLQLHHVLICKLVKALTPKAEESMSCVPIHSKRAWNWTI